MAHNLPSMNGIQGQAELTLRHGGPWVERMARIGYAAKGVIYMIVGVLAVEEAFNAGGKTTNAQGALTTILHQPFGQFLLALVGVGLAAYALWCFVEAGLDVDAEGSDARGMATRIGYCLSGIGYGILAYTALTLVSGAVGSANGNNSMQDWTARLLAVPFGQVLVGLIGLCIIGLGLAQIARGYNADFSKQLDLGAVPQPYRDWAITSGRWGYAARGVVFAIIGGFFLEAALHANARQAKGLGSALDLLAQQPYGPWLLVIIAAGLVAYGIFMLVEARYRRIRI